MPVLAKPDTIAGPLTAQDLDAARKHRAGNVWLLPRRASACTGDCRQGRDCTCTPDTVPVQPAEACTEMGADAVESMFRHRRTAATVRGGIALVALLAVAGFVVRAVWPLT